MAKLTVTRPKQWKDKMRSYKVLISNQDAVSIESGQTFSLDVPNEAFTIQAKIDWTSSPILDLDLSDGRSAKVEIKSNMDSFALWIVAILAIVSYLVGELVFERSYLFILLFALPFFVMEAYNLTLGRKRYLVISHAE